MQWVLKILRKHGLADAQSVCIDATTLEANAALKSLVRRDTGVSYDDYLRQLAEAEGIENASKEQLARLDRKRKKKASNDDWTNPNDPSARITKMKDGRTKLAYKAEHAVDLGLGRVARGDGAASRSRRHSELRGDASIVAQREARKAHRLGIEEVVMDKGYHSSAVLVDLAEREIRSYVPEPERGQRHWPGKKRKNNIVCTRIGGRVRAERSKRLQKLRGELCERSFAHCYETLKAMRRMYVRGEDNVFKRVLAAGSGVQHRIAVAHLERMGQTQASSGAIESATSASFRRVRVL